MLLPGGPGPTLAEHVFRVDTLREISILNYGSSEKYRGPKNKLLESFTLFKNVFQFLIDLNPVPVSIRDIARLLLWVANWNLDPIAEGTCIVIPVLPIYRNVLCTNVSVDVPPIHV